MKKILTLFLVLVILLGATACRGNSDNSSKGQSDNTETPTGRYILKDGVTDYKIVMPANNDGYEQSACSELVILFYEATGLNLPVIKDDGLTYNDNNAYFSIGNTTLLSSSGISVSKDAQVNNGFQISTKGNTVFFIGGGENGVLFAVYEFLFRTLNFEQFSYDCYSLDTAVMDMELMNYNVVDSPDIPLYSAFSGFMNRDRGVCLRMKATHQNDIVGGPNGYTSHNTLQYIKPSVYNIESDRENYHPEWFSSDLKQICYTAHGDEESLELLLSTVAEKMENCIKEQPTRYMWSFSNMDNASCCTCEKCNEYKAKYGCNTAQQIQFINRLYDKLMAWFASDEGKPYWREDFFLTCSFYEAYTDVPAKKNPDTGKYEPIDDSVVLKNGVMPKYAPIRSNYQVPIDDPVNTIYYDILLKLCAISSSIGCWIYSTDFFNYLYPYDVFGGMQGTYQVLYKNGCVYLLDETQNGNLQGMTGFHMLSSYLSAQFSWNVYADQEQLIDRFFKGYFLDAADDMKTFFNSWRDFSQLSRNVITPQQGDIYFGMDSRKNWPKAKIDEWQGYIASALTKIAKYKEINLEKYDMLYKHITLERVFLDYVYIRFYKGNLGSEFEDYRNRFIDAVNLHKITYYREYYSLADYIATLYDN